MGGGRHDLRPRSFLLRDRGNPGPCLAHITIFEMDAVQLMTFAECVEVGVSMTGAALVCWAGALTSKFAFRSAVKLLYVATD